MRLLFGAFSNGPRRAGGRTLVVAVALLLASVFAGFAAAQGGFFGSPFSESQPTPTNTEFVFARVQFNSGGGGFGFRGGGGGWAHDYPVAEHHILDLANRLTRINVQEESYVIVQLENEDIFQYPFLYFSEVGEMNLTPKEIENLQEYLGRGGIAMIDDFDGPETLVWFQDQMRKVFPERDFEEMQVDHPIFHAAFDVDTKLVIPPYQYGYPPRFYGYFDDGRRLGMIINHNNDIGDFWEWLDEPHLPLEGTVAGVRLGINYLLYSMSH